MLALVRRRGRARPYMLYAEERVRARALTADIPAARPPRRGHVRRGPQPALEEALSRAGPATLEEVGGVLVGKLSDARKLSRLEELLVPGRNGRSASRPRRSRSSRG